MKKTLLLLGMLAISFLGLAQVNKQHTALKAYYKNNGSIASDENLSHLASSLANKCDEKLGNYEEAIGWYENVLTDPSAGFNDSIFAAIDLGDLYLRMIEGVEKVTYGKMAQFKPESFHAHKLQTYAALDILPRQHGTKTLLEEDLPPINSLEIAIAHNDSVFLNWEISEDVTRAKLSWGDVNDDTEGELGQGQCASDAFYIFEPEDISCFNGWRIEEVSVFLSRYDTIYGDAKQYYLRIWKGDNDGDMNMVFEKEIENPTYSTPITTPIDSIILVEDGKQLRYGYHTEGRFMTWAFDWHSPIAPDNKGQGLILYHLDEEEDCVSDNYLFSIYYYNFALSAMIVRQDAVKDDHTLTGYRIYRDGTLIKEIPYSFVTYFTDTEFTRETDVEYCVTAVYGEEESEPVCATATITGVGEAMADDAVTLSPNPTNGIVQIDGTTAAKVKVYNASGQLVKTVLNTNQIDMSQMHEGFYLLRITATDGRVHVGKVTVNK